VSIFMHNRRPYASNRYNATIVRMGQDRRLLHLLSTLRTLLFFVETAFDLLVAAEPPKGVSTGPVEQALERKKSKYSWQPSKGKERTPRKRTADNPNVAQRINLKYAFCLARNSAFNCSDDLRGSVGPLMF
jgi:hypothetical protein